MLKSVNYPLFIVYFYKHYSVYNLFFTKVIHFFILINIVYKFSTFLSTLKFVENCGKPLYFLSILYFLNCYVVDKKIINILTIDLSIIES